MLRFALLRLPEGSVGHCSRCSLESTLQLADQVDLGHLVAHHLPLRRGQGRGGVTPRGGSGRGPLRRGWGEAVEGRAESAAALPEAAVESTWEERARESVHALHRGRNVRVSGIGPVAPVGVDLLRPVVSP